MAPIIGIGRQDFEKLRAERNFYIDKTRFIMEVRMMFRNMVRKWFAKVKTVYNDFIKALPADDIRAMNIYMNKLALITFSYFDTGNRPSRAEPERFYHGFGSDSSEEV